MFSIAKCPLPADTLLEPYSPRSGSYVDCYSAEVPGQISFPIFIFAFYTTPLFKLERAILKLTVSNPSTDSEVGQLADCHIEKFAAWNVESRNEKELLMCDFLGRTRSWLMVINNGARTRLYFGSAVVPKAGEKSLKIGFRAMLGFHQIYSVLLLASAASKLTRRS